MIARTRIAVALSAICLAVAACGKDTSGDQADVIVVGAGLAGLSAAVEMGRAGLDVVVVDMNSVPGGTAVRAGGIAIVGTPVQEQAGFSDSPELAVEDWLAWGIDGHPEWTQFYAENSCAMIYDWLVEMGVEFDRVVPSHGNSVPRFHFTEGRAVHVVLPLYRAALALPNVSFEWNLQATGLRIEDGAVSGVTVQNLRNGNFRDVRANHVVLATGGFQSDLERVIDNWTPGLPQPDSLMVGASVRSLGTGHDLATAAGADLNRIDRHYIYVNGIPDPRDPEHIRTLTASNELAMWVNAQGVRFTNETGFDKDILVDLLSQEPNTYWMIFDENGRDAFGMRGAAWLKNEQGKHPLLDDPKVTHQASSLSDLAATAGLPPDALEQSVLRFNDMIAVGEDADFGRFTRGDQLPPKIEQPPFYAVQIFPVTRKNMGGVAVDMNARVLDESGRPITGLYAAGELTGSVGINGRHGLDGMFLGPAIVTGRVAGRSVVEADPDRKTDIASVLPQAEQHVGELPTGVDEGSLSGLLDTERAGYWHFEQSHALVLERGYSCDQCHSAQAQTCLQCH